MHEPDQPRSARSPSEGGAAIPRGSRVVARGERTLLREPVLADAEEYLELRRRSASFHAPWEPATPPGVDPFERSVFVRYLESMRDGRRVRFLVCRRQDGAILGGINLNEIVRGAFQCAYLGYWIGAPHARRGYMREGLALALDHAFGELGLHRLEANIRPENVASIALVRGAGFRREGHSPKYLRIAGRWCDHERWAILAEEWNGRAH